MVVGVTDVAGQVAFAGDGTRMHDLNALLDHSGEGWGGRPRESSRAQAQSVATWDTRLPGE
jgi:hypothetical protein